jgi:hypothetical protein
MKHIMTVTKRLAAVLLCTALSLGTIDHSIALPMMNGGMQVAGDGMVVDVRATRGGGARAGGARSGAHVNRTNVNRANVSRNNVNVKRRGNVNVNVNRNVRVGGVGVRPVPAWGARPYYGRIVGGVALGSFIAVTAMGVVPVAPAPNMCWFWTDLHRRVGTRIIAKRRTECSPRINAVGSEARGRHSFG